MRDGHDTISGEYESGGEDMVRFGDLISADHLWFSRNGNHLDVTIIGTEDALTIEDWYQGADGPVETFVTAGGQELLGGDIETLVEAMAAHAPPALGETTLSSGYEDLQSVITAAWA